MSSIVKPSIRFEEEPCIQEVKRPKKPLIYFYVAMILAILIFNCLVAPYLAVKAIEDVDYGTFMTMTENGEIGKVQIQQNQIVFTDKEESAIYRSGKNALLPLPPFLAKI